MVTSWKGIIKSIKLNSKKKTRTIYFNLCNVREKL